MDKKGFLRILESALAVTAILVFIFISNSQTKISHQNFEDEIYAIELEILKTIQSNHTLRAFVIQENPNIDELNSAVNNLLQDYPLEGQVNVCDPALPCTIETEKETVYAKEIIISSTLQEFEPKKLALFVWTKF